MIADTIGIAMQADVLLRGTAIYTMDPNLRRTTTLAIAKLFSDGALGWRTAHLLEPYERRRGALCPGCLLSRNLHAATTRLAAHGEPPGGWYPHQKVSLSEVSDTRVELTMLGGRVVFEGVS